MKPYHATSRTFTGNITPSNFLDFHWQHCDVSSESERSCTVGPFICNLQSLSVMMLVMNFELLNVYCFVLCNIQFSVCVQLLVSHQWSFVTYYIFVATCFYKLSSDQETLNAT